MSGEIENKRAISISVYKRYISWPQISWSTNCDEKCAN